MSNSRNLEIEILRRYMGRVSKLRDQALATGRSITAEELNAAITPTAEEEAESLREMNEAMQAALLAASGASGSSAMKPWPASWIAERQRHLGGLPM